MKRQTAKLLLGLAGEYHVASEICRAGFYAAVTSKNYPDTDILAISKSGDAIGVQVKTSREKKRDTGFFVPENAAEIPYFVFVVVPKEDEQSYRTYIMLGEEVYRFSHEARNRWAFEHGKEPEKQLLMIWEARLKQESKSSWRLLFARLEDE
jgi:hypothetical protein